VAELLTPRLALRPMRDDDAEPLLLLFGDPGFMAAFDNEPPFDREQMDRWVNRRLVHQREHGYGHFTVLLRASGEVIGDCGLEHMQLNGKPEVELGYDLRRDQWGQGLGTEAAAAVVRFAVDELGIHRLVSLIRASNPASARIAARVGMHHECDLNLNGVAYRLYAMQ
jgi:RimJ/RimL family protein N-acetyltransferase